MIKRFFDLSFALIVLTLLLMPMMLIAVVIVVSSKGPALYWSKRIGKGNVIFEMPKFRTMKIDSPSLATHLLNNPSDFIFPVGDFLRKTSLDELPQLYSIIKGDMSIIGPRPALFNQQDLIDLRTEKGVDKILPGLTGWAQVNGRDELSIPEKVILDQEYLHKKSFWFDLKILWMSFLKVFKNQNISH